MSTLVVLHTRSKTLECKSVRCSKRLSRCRWRQRMQEAARPWAWARRACPCPWGPRAPWPRRLEWAGPPWLVPHQATDPVSPPLLTSFHSFWSGPAVKSLSCGVSVIFLFHNTTTHLQRLRELLQLSFRVEHNCMCIAKKAGAALGEQTHCVLG